MIRCFPPFIPQIHFCRPSKKGIPMNRLLLCLLLLLPGTNLLNSSDDGRVHTCGSGYGGWGDLPSC